MRTGPSSRTSSTRRRALARSLYPEREERPDWLEERLLRPGQVALLFQVSRRTIGDWARAGMIPAILTPGGHRRFRARDVRSLLGASEHPCGPPDDEGPPKGPLSRSRLDQMSKYRANSCG